MYDSPPSSNVLGIYMTSTLTRTQQGFTGIQNIKNGTTITQANSTVVWYHVVFTYNSTNAVLYRNGVGSTPVSTGSTGGVTITGIRIGSQTNNINPTFVGYAPADCSIDDLRVYNTALTAAEVTSLYNSQAFPNRANWTNTVGSTKAEFFT
jgi:hypothetical protein